MLNEKIKELGIRDYKILEPNQFEIEEKLFENNPLDIKNITYNFEISSAVRIEVENALEALKKNCDYYINKCFFEKEYLIGENEIINSYWKILSATIKASQFNEKQTKIK